MQYKCTMNQCLQKGGSDGCTSPMTLRGLLPPLHLCLPFIFLIYFLLFYLHIFTGADQLLNDQDKVINCFLVIGPAEFLCSKEVQIRHAFTSSQTLTNLKKEHINDAQLRNVISLTLLAACYQFERGEDTGIGRIRCLSNVAQ